MNDSKRLQIFLFYFLLAVYILNGLLAIQRNSVTSDELDHLSYGTRMLKGRPEKVIPYEDASTMPISALNALPRAVEQVLHPGLKKTDGGVSDVMHGRYVSLLICLLAAIFVYRWSKEMFGAMGGLFSLFLFVFCPNLQANIILVGTDAYAMLFVLTSAYYFRAFILKSGWKNFILFSSQLALAQISKQSLVLLFFFFAASAIMVLLHRGTLFSRLRINLTRLLVLITITIFVINLSFLFHGTGKPLHAYQFSSATFLSLQQIPVLNRLPFPLPAPFLEGFDQVKHMINLGSGNLKVSARSYLFGEYFTGNSVWYYYSMVILFKTPLTVLALLAVMLWRYMRNPLSKQKILTIGYPLALAFFFWFIISFFNRSQHSIRHLLMIYPLMYICMGDVTNLVWKGKRIWLALVLLYGMATYYFYFPNLIAYTNELIPDKKNVYRIFASSNIDHGQCGYYLREFMEKNKEVKWAPADPHSGDFIIGINDYLDLKQTGKYEWLRRYRPSGHVHHCYLRFTVSEKDLRQDKQMISE